MTELPGDLLAKAALSSMEEVFTTMLGLEALAGAPETKHDGLESSGGIMALVGIAGSWTGAGRLLVSPKLASTLAGALLGSEFLGVNEEVVDAIGEIANMVVGNAKTMLEERLGELSLSIPMVIFGKNFGTHSGRTHDWLVVPFQCQGEPIELRFCLMPTNVSARAGFQLELHQL